MVCQCSEAWQMAARSASGERKVRAMVSRCDGHCQVLQDAARLVLIRRCEKQGVVRRRATAAAGFAPCHQLVRQAVIRRYTMLHAHLLPHLVQEVLELWLIQGGIASRKAQRPLHS
jgi:hypothetical protein